MFFLQHKIKLKQANVYIFFILFLIDSNLQSVKYYANSCFILNVILTSLIVTVDVGLEK